MKKVFSALLVILLVLVALSAGIGGWNIPAMAAEPTIVQIAAGDGHSFALFSDKVVTGEAFKKANDIYKLFKIKCPVAIPVKT